jgi:hypothetical protein
LISLYVWIAVADPTYLHLFLVLGNIYAKSDQNRLDSLGGERVWGTDGRIDKEF